MPVSRPVQRSVTDYLDFTGRTDAVEAVDVRLRVTGYPTKVAFKEGAEVKKGDISATWPWRARASRRRRTSTSTPPRSSRRWPVDEFQRVGDRTKCEAVGVSVSDVFNALEIYLGSYYVSSFNAFGRTWQVNVRADPRFRAEARQIRQLQMRNRHLRRAPPG